ncbi:hypothetical protein ACF3OF_05500 [Sneathia vaginalis]|uniref:class III lanthionine synthetase LanKC N-terminal domain-containing protein n=1 Tax=Sneathia vaginalis TaxID=187101 RepID=UPI00370DB692
MITIKDKFSECIIKENKIFKFVVYNKSYDNEIPDEGWKIHISATIKNYQKILDIISKILINKKIQFKWIKSERFFYKTIIKTSNRIFSGKFITIYPKNTEQFYSILECLYKVLKNEQGPSITTDRQYKDCKVLHYRYGGFTDKSKLYCKNPYYEQPDYVEDRLYTKKNEDELGLLNNKYEVIDILHLSNGGGVLLCKNILDKKKYIIKEARDYIFFYKDKTVVDLRKNEKDKLLKLSGVKGIPKFVEDFYSDGSYFIVEEYIDNSITLYEYFENNNFIIKDTNNKESIKKIGNNILNIILKIKKMVQEINKIGYLLEDISPVNFIISDDNIYFIDLELCANINSPNLLFRRREHKYLTKKNKNFIYRDEIKIGFMFLEQITKYNKMFSILKNRELWVDLLYYIIDEYNFPMEIYENILKLISKNDDILKHKFEIYNSNKTNCIKRYIPDYRLNLQIKNEKQNLENLFFITNENFCMNEKITKSIQMLEQNYKRKNRSVRDIMYLIIFQRVYMKGHIFNEINLKNEYENYKKRYLDQNKIRYKGKYLPYIIGNSGLIIYEIERNNKISKQVKQYLKIIDTKFCNKINFEFGISGIIYTYLKLYLVSKEKKYLFKAKKFYELLCIYLNSNDIILKLKLEKNKLFNGLEGIDYVLCELLKIKEVENEA